MTDAASILDEICNLSSRTSGLPSMARLEVGAIAIEIIKAKYASPGMPPRDQWKALGVDPHLWGIPLSVPDGDDVLSPMAWRLMDGHGGIIKEGVL